MYNTTTVEVENAKTRYSPIGSRVGMMKQIKISQYEPTFLYFPQLAVGTTRKHIRKPFFGFESSCNSVSEVV